MDNIRTGQELVLEALEKGLADLSRIAERAAKAADENMTIGSEYVAIHKEFAEIVQSNAPAEEQLKKLKALKERESRANKIMKRDLVTLLDKQHKAETERDRLAEEIQRFKFLRSLRGY